MVTSISQQNLDLLDQLSRKSSLSEHVHAHSSKNLITVTLTMIAMEFVTKKNVLSAPIMEIALMAGSVRKTFVTVVRLTVTVEMVKYVLTNKCVLTVQVTISVEMVKFVQEGSVSSVPQIRIVKETKMEDDVMITAA